MRDHQKADANILRDIDWWSASRVLVEQAAGKREVTSYMRRSPVIQTPPIIHSIIRPSCEAFHDTRDI